MRKCPLLSQKTRVTELFADKQRMTFQNESIEWRLDLSSRKKTFQFATERNIIECAIHNFWQITAINITTIIKKMYKIITGVQK